jgi:hypothetical protein
LPCALYNLDVRLLKQRRHTVAGRNNQVRNKIIVEERLHASIDAFHLNGWWHRIATPNRRERNRVDGAIERLRPRRNVTNTPKCIRTVGVRDSCRRGTVNLEDRVAHNGLDHDVVTRCGVAYTKVSIRQQGALEKRIRAKNRIGTICRDSTEL